MTSQTGSEGLTRRQFLKASAATTAGIGLSSVAFACGGSDSGNSSGSGQLGQVSYAFSWILNVQQAGSYIAKERGYYRKAGVDVTFIPGGTTYAAEPIVASGKALLAMSAPQTTGAAVNQGADLRIVATQYQQNPLCMISLAKNPIPTAKQLVGKTIAVQPNVEPQWRGFLKVNNLEGQVHSVPSGRDPSVLTSGSVDAFIGFITNDAVALKVQKVPIVTFLLGDYGTPGFYLTYLAASASLNDKKKRAQIKALLEGEIRGWQVQVGDPKVGLQLTLDKYGKGLGLDPAQQQIQSEEQNQLIVSPTTKQHGLFWMSAEDIDRTANTLGNVGTPVKKSLFDNGLLGEIYNGHSSL